MISRLEMLLHGFGMMYVAKREPKCVECCVGLGSPRSRQQGGMRHVRDFQGGTPVREKEKEPERVGEPSDHVQF